MLGNDRPTWEFSRSQTGYNVGRMYSFVSLAILPASVNQLIIAGIIVQRRIVYIGTRLHGDNFTILSRLGVELQEFTEHTRTSRDQVPVGVSRNIIGREFYRKSWL